MAQMPTDTTRRTPARRGSGDALRSEIIEATSELLAETGDVQSVSLRAVARRVGIATTSIYLHFADIDELLLAVKLLRFAELTATLRAALEQAGSDPLARVRSIGHAYVEFGLQHPGHYRVMFSASTRGRLIGPDGLMVGLDAFNALAGELAAALGLSVDDPSVHLVTTNLWSFVHGVVHLRTARPFFPWPDLNPQIDDTVDRMLNLR
jgi:AcrR family transcriptional regulator